MGIKKLSEIYLSLEEYWKLEEESDVKHEFHHGQVTAMAGGTVEHSLISANAVGSLREALNVRNKECITFNSDLKIYIEAAQSSVYPDAMVVCGKIDKHRKDAITNPILIVEVFSDSTKDYDEGEKFERYKKLPSFKEYVLVSQDQPFVKIFFKDENQASGKEWKFPDYIVGLEKTIHLQSIDYEISMKDLYCFIEFSGGFQKVIEF